MKSIIITLALFSIPIFSVAQISLERQVLSTTGDQYMGGNLQIDYTLGEPFITTLTGADLVLTQGFHQSNVNLVGINTPNGIRWDVRHFPNPTQSQLSVEVEGEVTGILTLQVVDVKGKIIYREQVEKGFGSLTHRIPVELWADGTYFLHIQQGEQEGVTLPFQKVH